jgi:hypothetical protein
MRDWRYSSTHCEVWNYMKIKSFLHARAAFSPEGAQMHWIGGWVGLRICLDAVKKRKALSLLTIKPRFIGLPAHSLVSTLSELSLPLVLKCAICNDEMRM